MSIPPSTIRSPPNYTLSRSVSLMGRLGRNELDLESLNPFDHLFINRVFKPAAKEDLDGKCSFAEGTPGSGHATDSDLTFVQL